MCSVTLLVPKNKLGNCSIWCLHSGFLIPCQTKSKLVKGRVQVSRYLGYCCKWEEDSTQPELSSLQITPRHDSSSSENPQLGEPNPAGNTCQRKKRKGGGDARARSSRKAQAHRQQEVQS